MTGRVPDLIRSRVGEVGWRYRSTEADEMKLWLFERDKWDYDEFDAVVVLAPDAETAKRIVREKESPHGDGYLYGGQFYGVEPTEVDLTVPGVVLDSFNAG